MSMMPLQRPGSSKSFLSIFVIAMSAGLLAGCNAGSTASNQAPISDKTKFSSATFGVAASPRVETGKTVRKGGGRRHVGKPYKVRGRWYYPKDEPGYDRTGKSSWYGPNFHGRLTANGEVYDMYSLSAAHPTFPLPSYARVTNLKNGNTVIVRVNDRGPFSRKRIIDVSSKAADLLNFKKQGTATVRVEYLGAARMDGQDMPHLLASFRPGSGPVAAPAVPQVQMAAAPEPASAVPLPGIHQDTIATPTVQPVDSVTVPVPIPVPSPASSAYAATASSTPDSFYAAMNSSEGKGEGSYARHILLGVFADRRSVADLATALAGEGTVTVSRLETGAYSASLQVTRQEDADQALRAAWQAGARDAFSLRP